MSLVACLDDLAMQQSLCVEPGPSVFLCVPCGERLSLTGTPAFSDIAATDCSS